VVHIFGENWNFEAYAEKQSSASVAETFSAFKNDTGQLNRWYVYDYQNPSRGGLRVRVRVRI